MLKKFHPEACQNFSLYPAAHRLGIAWCNQKNMEVFMANSIIKRNNGTYPVQTNTMGGWVDQLLNENLNRFFSDDFWGFRGVEQQGSIPVNLRETDKSYEMSLIAPGLRKQDFRLNITDNLLTISYEEKQDQNQENKEDGWLRKEYRMQSFSRSFSLDDTVDSAKISASYDNGILHLTLPKKENAQRISKSIEVK